ncbi:hypothetical protein BC829DRAFT_413932 [Chytridium lagenaria]|nr:hypothetical protein BC829DRAFT_413932 [Chytridium lagenaria]
MAPISTTAIAIAASIETTTTHVVIIIIYVLRFSVFVEPFINNMERKPLQQRLASLSGSPTPPARSEPSSLSSSVEDLPVQTPPLPPPVEQVQRDIRIYTKYFQRYELLIE